MNKRNISKRCGTCSKWHKAKNYECQHAGPYGGGFPNLIFNCKWTPKIKNKKKEEILNHKTWWKRVGSKKKWETREEISRRGWEAAIRCLILASKKDIVKFSDLNKETMYSVNGRKAQYELTTESGLYCFWMHDKGKYEYFAKPLITFY